MPTHSGRYGPVNGISSWGTVWGTNVSSASTAPWSAVKPMATALRSWCRVNDTTRWAIRSRMPVESSRP